MSAIGPGDWVECIRGDDGTCGRCETVPGNLYQVSDVLSGRWCVCGCSIGLRLTGDAHNADWTHCPSRFRPIWRGDKTLIETLLEPVADAIPDQVATEVSRVGAL